MAEKYHLVHYSVEEERLNRITHALGFLASSAGLVMLVIAAAQTGDPYRIVSASIFGCCLSAFYIVSTLYHSVQSPKMRSLFRVLDHASIYIVIAATYTPFVLVTLRGNGGWTLFAIVWGLAIAGVIYKSVAIHRMHLLATGLYVAMGWMIVLKIDVLTSLLPTGGLVWLIAGGVTYTLGVVFYVIDKIPCNHAIWHLFVIGGSVCHYFAIYYYVI